MDISVKISLFLAIFIQFSWGNIHSQEEEFTFDLPETIDLPTEGRPRRILNSNEYVAVVGKVFHLAVPSINQKFNHIGYVAKQHNRKGLPHWLAFNKKTGIFWGIPLQGDEGRLDITISLLSENFTSEHISINVLPNEEETEALMEKCKPKEDNTVLTLLIDKNLRNIKPKQRVVAVNNIANFFKLPYSAFTFKPQFEKDNLNDRSIILAGPGNMHDQSSKITCYLEVLIGCDGRLWESTAPLIYNLKQQARDGTISEVLRLPLIGWRVKTYSKLRSKRQAVEDYGSGDYDDDYYEEYEDDYDEDDLGDLETNPPGPKQPVTIPVKPSTSSTSSSTTTTTTSITPSSSPHPHRHHHGELKPGEENISIIPIKEDSLKPESEVVTTIDQLSTNATSVSPHPGTTKIDIPKPNDALDFEESYDYGEYDDQDDTDDDPVESETIIPDINRKTVQPTNLDIDTGLTTEIIPPKTITKETIEQISESEPSSTTPAVKLSTVTTELSTTVEIVEDTEPPTHAIYITDLTPPVITISSNTSQENAAGITEYTSTTTTTSTTSSTSTTPPETHTTSVLTTESLTTMPPVTTVSVEYSTKDMDYTKKSTTVRHVSSSSTTESLITEYVEPINRNIPQQRNFKPYIENRLQYVSVTAGKVFRYVIPKNTFKDAEDGYNLTLQVLDTNEQPISKKSWLQFNSIRKELYGLPLAEDVSNWVYILRAFDKEGEFEQDQLTIQVQQHRLERVFNHEFSLNLRIEKPQEYPHYVDWSLKILRALGRIYNTNMSEITIRNISYKSEPVIFSWSNDSLPTNYCPRGEIERLYKMLTANDRGDPARELSHSLTPDLRVKKVVYRNLSICEQPAPPVTPSTNFSPILRNPVDMVNATLGELLIYKVKDDTFYDPEDVDPLMLNITLLTSDLQGIPPTNWLQFDSKNREFFGIPRKTGRTEYWLVCVDSGGMSVKDSLEVFVHPAVKRPYNVEFSMTLDVPYETFSNNAVMQKKFVEKLMEIFEEPTSTNFHFLPFKVKREQSLDSTVVLWFNKSLPVDRCHTEEIRRLEYLLHDSESRSISSRVHRIMSPDFTVSTIKVHHVGNCKSKPQIVPPPDIPVIPVEDTATPTAENEVLITFVIPAIVISVMIFIAAIAACILYRRKRLGKMNIEEDGRQSYGNKGIPVIFQEELEEKPEPGTKTPVILKDEKPPLAPPEYSKSGSVKLEDSEPYQPPPPFTRTQDSGRQPRPKPTPTYRKPPPYVPP